jgi:hypothetical protein
MTVSRPACQIRLRMGTRVLLNIVFERTRAQMLAGVTIR